MTDQVALAAEVERLNDLFKQQQYRMRVYLWIFGIMIMAVGAIMSAVFFVANGARNQSIDNHRFGETNRVIICYNAEHVAHGDPLPEGC